MRDYLAPLYRRRIEGERANGDTTYRWSATWWNHAEAIARLEALWRAWEHLRLDPATGMSVWFRDHADHHMPVLLSSYGPFRQANDKTTDGEPLPHTPAPDGLFQEVTDRMPER